MKNTTKNENRHGHNTSPWQISNVTMTTNTMTTTTFQSIINGTKPGAIKATILKVRERAMKFQDTLDCPSSRERSISQNANRFGQLITTVTITVSHP
jgi:hypothetical protein